MAVVTLHSVDRIVSRARFLMAAAVALQTGLLAIVIAAGVVWPVGVQVGQMDAGTFAIVASGIAWFLLVMHSLREGQHIRQAAALINRGQTLQAVPFLAMILEKFSVFRLPKLIALRHLMDLARSQKDAPVAARLAREIIRHNLAWRHGIARRACLTLAESLMDMGDDDGAGQALARLDRQKLTIGERLELLPILLRWQMCGGKYAQAVEGLEEKVRLAALLDAERACLVHVLLAAACRYRGREDVWRFLLRRAGLHYNLEALARRNPSVARHLLELQAVQSDSLTDAGGRTTHVQAAGMPGTQDLQSASEST